MSALAFAVILVGAFPLVPRAADMSGAIECYGRGEYQKAISMLTRSPAATSDSPELRLWTAKAYLQLRQWDGAIAELERAVDLDGSNCTLHLWLGRAYGGKASHASLLNAISLAKKVRVEFELARSLCPEDRLIRFDLLSYYLEAPGFLGGGLDKAAKEIDEIAGQDSRAGHTARAMLAKKNKNWDLARDELTQATHEFPDSAEAYADLAVFLYQRADFAAAAASARGALRLRNAYPRAQLVLASSQIETRTDIAAAVHSLEGLSAGPLLDDDPPFAEVYYQLGKGYTALGRRSDAVAALETSLRFDPEHAGAKGALAALLQVR